MYDIIFDLIAADADFACFLCLTFYLTYWTTHVSALTKAVVCENILSMIEN